VIRDGHRISTGGGLPQPFISGLEWYTSAGVGNGAGGDLRCAEGIHWPCPKPHLARSPVGRGHSVASVDRAARDKQMIFTGASIDAVSANVGMVQRSRRRGRLGGGAAASWRSIARIRAVAVQATKQQTTSATWQRRHPRIAGQRADGLTAIFSAGW
jgi:hypothetical protein